jgi:hypothetical protein
MPVKRPVTDCLPLVKVHPGFFIRAIKTTVIVFSSSPGAMEYHFGSTVTVSIGPVNELFPSL